MPKVGFTMVRCNYIERFAQRVIKRVFGAGGLFLQETFELGSAVLDGIELRTIRRSVQDLGAGLLDPLDGFFAVVGRGVI
jgi:hypothetical protein